MNKRIYECDAHIIEENGFFEISRTVEILVGCLDEIPFPLKHQPVYIPRSRQVICLIQNDGVYSSGRRPLRTAKMAACVRSAKCSLDNRLLTCVFTVR